MATARYTPSTPPGETPPGMARYLVQEFYRLTDYVQAIGQAALGNFVSIGYGGVRLSEATVLPDIGAAPQVLPFNAGVIAAPVGVTQDFANDGLRIDGAGIWRLSYIFSMTHNELNASRLYQLQFWDATAGAELALYTLGTGRNVQGSDWTGALIFEIPTAKIGNLLQWRTSGSAYSTVTLYDNIMTVNSVSQYTEV